MEPTQLDRMDKMSQNDQTLFKSDIYSKSFVNGFSKIMWKGAPLATKILSQ